MIASPLGAAVRGCCAAAARGRQAAAASVLVVALIVAGACAPQARPPLVATPSFPDFVYPAVPATLGDTQVWASHQRGWRALQAGDQAGAEREFSGALKRLAAFYPSEAGLGYVALSRHDFRDALGHFDRALHQASGYAPALVGRGEALLSLSREDEALKSFQAALAVDPSLAGVHQRVEVLSLRITQNRLAAARKAVESGRLDEAKSAYMNALASSPDSAFLYRDLAAVERKQGDDASALEHLRKAVSIDASDARSLVQIGEILESRGDVDGALKAFTGSAAIEPGDAISERISALRHRADLARLPEAYRAIPTKPQITRADLAALIGVRFDRLLQSSDRQDAIVMTDLRGAWAAPWIQAVTRAGVMDAYPNHTFQPGGLVTRGDLAHVMSRLLALVPGRRPPATGGAGTSWAPRIADLPPTHLGYPAAAAVVAAGLMPLVEGDAFHPSRVVSGAEAIDVLSRFEALARREAPTGDSFEEHKP
jgi:tetratricopeptide (TPR) repeat protein